MESDFWSVGVVIFTMICKRPIFASPEPTFSKRLLIIYAEFMATGKENVMLNNIIICITLHLSLTVAVL